MGGAAIGAGEVVVAASAGTLADKVTRPLRVVSRGFPVEVAQGGLLEPDSGREFPVVMPATRVAGSVTSRVIVYPTPMASLTEALARLIREPNGCFEQTSSTTFPLVMAQQYFLTHQGVDPALVSRSREVLGARLPTARQLRVREAGLRVVRKGSRARGGSQPTA